mmetsp:Transcript_9813/g.30283  ORF Transcript_9813/g.30283 Transcript_9813/m.30283 type:complete len:217 (-) Transcript_9813:342-992(-)
MPSFFFRCANRKIDVTEEHRRRPRTGSWRDGKDKSLKAASEPVLCAMADSGNFSVNTARRMKTNLLGEASCAIRRRTWPFPPNGRQAVTRCNAQDEAAEKNMEWGDGWRRGHRLLTWSSTMCLCDGGRRALMRPRWMSRWLYGCLPHRLGCSRASSSETSAGSSLRPTQRRIWSHRRPQAFGPWQSPCPIASRSWQFCLRNDARQPATSRPACGGA